MSTKEAYKKGQRDMLKCIAVMGMWAVIFVIALIKAGIYVI